MKERDVGGMRCSQVLALLSDYVDGELDPSAVRRIEDHLLGCANCERFGRNFGSMVVALRQESQHRPEASIDVVSRLLQRLRKADAEP